ncbi:hypothetical protein BZA77DRAFT_319009 [Pyronema omphalodes]|nr:hypothetical protein BZA77DRAFT_319009 [Pyronema omphalodes]
MLFKGKWAMRMLVAIACWAWLLRGNCSVGMWQRGTREREKKESRGGAEGEQKKSARADTSEQRINEAIESINQLTNTE